jgi:hypothetical protein
MVPEMSNPLLRPNDPRFQRPELRDDAGQNRFTDASDPTPDTPAAAANNYAAAGGEARPFQPRYDAQQPARTGLLYLLGGLGLAGMAVGLLALLRIFTTGWIAPLLGLAPAAAAWLLAWEDLKAIRIGAIGEQSRPGVRLALWLGLVGFFACAAVVASMIYREMTFLPDVL